MNGSKTILIATALASMAPDLRPRPSQCETCTCGTPTDTCGGAVEFRNGACDSGLIDTTPIDGCSPEVQGTFLFATYIPGENASCAPNDPQVVGTAEGTDPVTFCCLL
jgi:hypothetical protein